MEQNPEKDQEQEQDQEAEDSNTIVKETEGHLYPEKQ